MRYSTADYLNVITPYLPAQLVSSHAVSHIHEVASLLPPSSNFGFECTLGSAAADADFLVAVIPSDGSRSAWCGRNPFAQVPPLTRTHPIWATALRFFEAWDGDATSYGSIFDTWMEFDMDGATRTLPPPSLFFGFDHGDDKNYPDVSLKALQQLLAPSTPQAVLENVRRCYAALPRDTQIFQVGLMLARSTQAVRLCIKRIAPGQLVPYLEQIGWQGPRDEVRQWASELARHVDGFGLDIDVGEGVLPRFGLECAIRGKDPGRKRLRTFLSYLSEAECCLPEKADALLDWLGFCTSRTDAGRWPAYLRKASQAAGHDAVSALARTLNHTKVVYTPGKPLIAKAYLGVRHFWIRQGIEEARS